MGLLDEAIREHLELKRRRGADPGEIARQESEAFGPVVREAVAAAAPAPGNGGAALAEPAGAVPFETQVEPPEATVPEAEPLPDPEPDPLPDPEPLAEPEAAHQRTAEFAAEDFAAATRREPLDDEDAVVDDEEHDELEETPEFLQETPEHDRLWFEQKPPRDFDF